MSLSESEYTILGDVIANVEENDFDGLRPEDIAVDAEDFWRISDAMLKFHALGLGEAAFNGNECCGFTPDLRRCQEAFDGWVDAQKRGGAGARSTTKLVHKLCYSVEEAEEAKRLIDGRVAAGSISKRAGAAYKANVTRRVSDEHALQTLTIGKRTIRKVWRDDEDVGYEAFQYQAADGLWHDYHPTVQEVLAFVAAKG